MDETALIWHSTGMPQAVIGHAAGERETALGDIQARHRFLELAETAAARGESGNGLWRAFGRAQEIGIERENDVGFFQIVDRLEQNPQA